MSKFSLKEVFTHPPREPFSLDLQFNIKDHTLKKFYERLKEFYLIGINHITNNSCIFKIPINLINDTIILKMKKYMLSFGIDVYFREYNDNDIDYISRNFLYDLEKLNSCKIKTTIEWKTKHIEQIMLRFDKKDKDFKQDVKKYLKIIPSNNEVNILFKFLKPQTLKEHGLIVKHNKKTYILYFDFANRALYEKPFKM